LGHAVTEWRRRVAEAGRLALDTNALIYFLDRTMPYYPLCAAVFGLAEDGRIEIVVPTLAEVELLVGLTRKGDDAGIARLGLLLERFPGLTVAPLDRAAALAAARLRAHLGLATPDALLAGTALAAGCNAVVGNDRLCRERLTEPAYLYLSDYTG
jgi:predicted nucleic acid-binding protein